MARDPLANIVAAGFTRTIHSHTLIMRISKIFLDGFIDSVSISNQDQVAFLDCIIKPVFCLFW